jgi:ribosome modulation factor
MVEEQELAVRAFREGQDAYARSLPVTACPYPNQGVMRDAWIKGWSAGGGLDVDGEPAAE